MTDYIINFDPVIEFATAFSIVIVWIVCLYIIGKITKLLVIRSKSIPPDAKNGLSIIIGILQLFLILFGTGFFLGVSLDFLLGSSTIFATALGFAATSVAANIVGGLYIIITRPFGIGDFIKLHGVEGVVVEIGLNYTQIMRLDRTIVTIPNSTLLSASLVNSTVSTNEEVARKERIVSRDFRKLAMLTLMDQEMIRFPTLVQLKLNILKPPIPIKTVIERIDTVCEVFAPIFGFPIRYYFGKHLFRQDCHIVITASDSDTLMENYPLFMEELMVNIFLELQEEASS